MPGCSPSSRSATWCRRSSCRPQGCDQTGSAPWFRLIRPGAPTVSAAPGQAGAGAHRVPRATVALDPGDPPAVTFARATRAIVALDRRDPPAVTFARATRAIVALGPGDPPAVTFARPSATSPGRRRSTRPASPGPPGPHRQVYPPPPPSKCQASTAVNADLRQNCLESRVVARHHRDLERLLEFPRASGAR